MSDGTWQDTATAPKDRRISLKTASGGEISHADWGMAFSGSSSSKKLAWRNCKGGSEVQNATHWRDIQT
jgi:hypothetical protein